MSHWCRCLQHCQTICTTTFAKGLTSAYHFELAQKKIILKEHSREVLAQESADFTQGPLMSSCKHF